MLKTELWGHSLLLLWYCNNWESPKFGVLFVGREELVDIAAPAQPLLARAQWEKAHVGAGDAQRNVTWHTPCPYLCFSTKAREFCCALLPGNGTTTLLVGQCLGSLLQNHSAWEILP